MDDLDRKLLALVQADGRRPHAGLAAEVGLSLSAVNERLKKLLAQGVITGYGARVSPRAMGLDICAFVQVLIERPEHDEAFLAAVQSLPEVQECHHVTGDYSYLLKIRARDTVHLEQVIKDRIKTVPGLVRSNTVIALSTAKETWAVDCLNHEA
jgi:Lrp/AsnC family leucine-responsive transcriptional regulator